MKIKIIIILIFITLNLISQNQYASPFNFKWGSSSSPRVLNIDSFSVNKFMLGFQWSGTAKLMNAFIFTNS